MAKTLKEILFRSAARCRREILEHGERSAIGSAAARLWQAYDGLLEAAELHDEFDAYERGKASPAPAEETEWDAQERAVTLTNDEWNTLTCYLMQTTKHRTGERDAWQSLAEEKNPDGTPKFPNAPKNAAYWQEVIDTMERIIPKLDGMER